MDRQCMDCDVDVHQIDEAGYMLRSTLWRLVMRGLRYRGPEILCIGCVEGRLGRELDMHDFACLGVNLSDFGPKSKRLQERLGEFDHIFGEAAKRSMAEINSLNTLSRGLVRPSDL